MAGVLTSKAPFFAAVLLIFIFGQAKSFGTHSEFPEVKDEMVEFSQPHATLMKEKNAPKNVEDLQKPNDFIGKSTASEILREEKVKAIRKKMVIDQIKKKLQLEAEDLNRLDGQSVDTNTQRSFPELPQALLDETSNEADHEEENDHFAWTKRKVIAGQDWSKECLGLRKTRCSRFEFKDNFDAKIVSAKLWIHKSWCSRDVKEQSVSVYELEEGSETSFLKNSSLIARQLTVTDQDWLTLNITRAANRWVTHDRESSVLAIHCTTNHKDSFWPSPDPKSSRNPLIVLDFSPNYRKREKRSGQCQSLCCKRPLRINLHEIGMTYVQHPVNVDVGYCYGSCSPSQYNSNHTRVKIEHVNRSTLTESERDQLAPCCVPVVLTSIDLVMNPNRDRNEVHVKDFTRLKVVECGCL
ncbi:growth/differentiation factor 8-like [Plakobranchus ocellatus]|uniref:Growth/differentiation factor 8-like n=1 Tax=Plakobranchus ocellatus TaxID=259542 RepID=A0AAV4CZ03_9GAST|nr:growth/differentiation factor 8-like [Plakobranchus ocellatus]